MTWLTSKIAAPAQQLGNAPRAAPQMQLEAAGMIVAQLGYLG
jgi:hypothetical protein